MELPALPSISIRRITSWTTILLLVWTAWFPSTLSGQTETPSESDIPGLLSSGQKLYEQERFDEADTFFQQIVRLQPGSSEAHYWLGMNYYGRKQDKEAIKSFQEALRLDRRNVEAYVGLGRVYMRTKNRMIEARQTLKDGLKYDPTHAQAHYYLGLSYMEQSRRDLAAPLYVMEGRKAFQQAIAGNPRHPDAYYQLALSYENPSRDYASAMTVFYKQLAVNPTHHEALTHFGRCSFLTHQYREGVDLLQQLIALYGDQLPDYARTLTAQLNAAYLQSQKKYEEAGKVYDEYITSLTPQEQTLYRDLSLVLSGPELTAYQTASEVEKKEQWRRFWAARDPDPATVINERLIEHYRRIMHAREYYSQAQFPWDRRGDMYIRFGDPNDLQHFIIRAGEKALVNYHPTGDSRIDAIRERNYLLRYRLKVDNAGASWGTDLNRQIMDPQADDRAISEASRNAATFMLLAGEETQGLAFVAESWVYIEHDLEIFFVDQLGMGKFDYPLGIHETNMDESSLQDRFHPKRIAEDLIRRKPESFIYDYGGEPLDFIYDVTTFKGSTEDSVLVEFSYAAPADQLGSVADGQGLHTWFDSHMALRDSEFHRIATAYQRIGPIERPLEKPDKNRKGVRLHTGQLAMQAPSGQYRSAVEVRDSASRRIGIFEAHRVIPDYSGDSLRISDIKLSLSIAPVDKPGPFVRNGLRVEPNPSRLFQRSEPVYFYYEIYKLSPDSQGRVSYQTELEVTAVESRRNMVMRLLSGLGNLVRRTDREQTIQMLFENQGNTRDMPQHTSIDTGDSPAGRYLLTIRITDLVSRQSVTSSRTFVITDDRGQSFRSGAVQDMMDERPTETP